MNTKLAIYTFAGALTVSAATVLLTHTSTEDSLQAATLTPFTDSIRIAQTQLGKSNQPTSLANTTPFPSRPGMMMGQPDQHFVVMMIPHHEGAVAMAELASNRAKHPEIKKLAEAIKTTQTQEIEEMRTWYKQQYGTDVPAGGCGMGMGMRQNWNNGSQNWQGKNPRLVRKPGMGMSFMGRGGMGRMGSDLYALQNATDFDREFIEQMIPHHQMGIRMASMAVNRGTDPKIRNLAQSMLATQSAEIEQMQQWYQTWYQ